MNKHDGGVAFPTIVHDPQHGPWTAWGMSLRDYFAALAMGSLIQRLGPIVKVAGTGLPELMPDSPAVTEEDGRQIRQAVAVVSYEYADAMLKAREVE